MVRNPKAAISKDVFCVTGLTHANRARAWLGAVGEGGRQISRGVPVLSTFYGQFPEGGPLDDELSSYLKDRAIYGVGRVLEHGGAEEVTDENRYQFWLATGMTPDEQRVVEESVQDWEPGADLQHGALCWEAKLLDFASTA